AAARVAIGVGFVKQGDPEIERLVHHLLRRCEIDPATEIVAAEANRRDEQAGPAESSLFHRRALSPAPGACCGRRHYRGLAGETSIAYGSRHGTADERRSR